MNPALCPVCGDVANGKGYCKPHGKYGNRGVLLTHTQDGTPAIYQDGTLYKQSRRYRDGETSGKRVHEAPGAKPSGYAPTQPGDIWGLYYGERKI